MMGKLAVFPGAPEEYSRAAEAQWEDMMNPEDKKTAGKEKDGDRIPAPATDFLFFNPKKQGEKKENVATDEGQGKHRLSDSGSRGPSQEGMLKLSRRC